MKETMMKPSLDPFTAAPETMQAMLDLERRVKNSGLEHSLIELVRTRASQINGCAYCVQMHTRVAGITALH
jgi:alkylhydroperoxidase family enzyme